MKRVSTRKARSGCRPAAGPNQRHKKPLRLPPCAAGAPSRRPKRCKTFKPAGSRGAAGPAHAPPRTAGPRGSTRRAGHGLLLALRPRAGGYPPRRPSRPPPDRHARTGTGNGTWPRTGGPEAGLPARGRLPHGAAGAFTSGRAAPARGEGVTEGVTGGPEGAAGRRARQYLTRGKKGRPARGAAPRSARPWRAAVARGFQAARAQRTGPAPAGGLQVPACAAPAGRLLWRELCPLP